MKNAWRDDARRLEGEFYQKLDRVPASGVAVMYSYGIFHVDGVVDAVALRIR